MLGPLEDNTVFDQIGPTHRGVGRLLEVDNLAAAPRSVTCDEHFAGGIFDPINDRVGRETTEYD
jgi:hypothetical protein